MNITKELLKTLRPEIDAALAEVAKRHGLKIVCGNASFTTGTFSFKLEGSVIGGKSKEAERYEASAGYLGLPPLGSEITIQGRKFKTCGLNSTGTKVLIENEDGKGFQTTVDAVARQFAAKVNA